MQNIFGGLNVLYLYIKHNEREIFYFTYKKTVMISYVGIYLKIRKHRFK